MSNRLAQESSPYLLQHAENPVNWYPWGEEALNRAREEHKLIIVSIGYAACHWCHVMEQESFEDHEVAALMNEHFICIKVDREERPDVDKVYMDAIQLMTGRGGWPLNAVALPDGKPVYGGTYFRKEQWLKALQQVVDLWANEPEKATEYAEHLIDAMKKLAVEISQDQSAFTPEDLYQIRSVWMEQVDFKWGGRAGGENKFPLPQNLIMLSRAGFFLKDETMLAAADIALEKIAYGGIYDHVGGGFARYSVDTFWKVPHFEKMLYDNSQLVSAYAEAYQRTGRHRYRRVVEETLAFISRELTSDEGGCYSSLDADSEGVEGKFYTWTYDEINRILGADARLFCDYYNVHPFGNWEESNVLFVLEEEEEFAERWNLDVDIFRSKLAAGRAELLNARAQRERPGLDQKMICAWNAMMVQGYLDAWRAIGRASYLQSAVRIAEFLIDNMMVDGRLFRNANAGEVTIPAFLDDYAMLMKACLSLYQATFDSRWIQEARKLCRTIDQYFFDEDTSLYFYTSSEGEQLIHRKMETQDDVMPSSNAVMSENLFVLGLIQGDSELLKKSQKMLLVLKEDILTHPAWHAMWGQRMLKELFPVFEVVFTGPDAVEMLQDLGRRYYPGLITAGGTDESIPLVAGRVGANNAIYVCENQSCKFPVSSVSKAWEMIID